MANDAGGAGDEVQQEGSDAKGAGFGEAGDGAGEAAEPQQRNRDAEKAYLERLEDARQFDEARRIFEGYRDRPFCPLAVACAVMGVDTLQPNRFLHNEGIQVFGRGRAARVRWADVDRWLDRVDELIGERGEAGECPDEEGAKLRIKPVSRREALAAEVAAVNLADLSKKDLWTPVEAAAYLRTNVDVVHQDPDLRRLRKKGADRRSYLLLRVDVMRHGGREAA